MNQEKISVRQGLVFSIVYGITVIFICCLFHSNFFCIDDAQQEMLGFFRQIGHIWRQGLIPFIVDSMYIGGNEMIDLGKGIFLPQNILISFLASKYHNIYLLAILLAFINITLIALSSLCIAKILKLRNSYAYAFASLTVIQPVFLYQYLGAWWNAASGQAWATVSIATFLLLKNNFSKTNIILNFTSVVFLLVAGWPHGVIGYAVFVFITLIFEFKQSSRLKKVLLLCIPNLMALIFVLPVYTEYIYSVNLVNRVSGFFSGNRSFTPSWSMVILSFFPTSYDYMNYWSYRLITIPFGFSTLFLPLVFFYRNVKILWHQNNILKWLWTLILVFFLLTQTLGQTGPLRWPFRFLPFLSLFICLAVFYSLEYAPMIKTSGIKFNKIIYLSLYFIFAGILLCVPLYLGFDILVLVLIFILILFFIERNLFDFNKSILAHYNKNYFITIIFSALLICFNTWEMHRIYFLLHIFSIWLLLLSPSIVEKKNPLIFIGSSLIILSLMLSGLSTIGNTYLPETEMADSIRRSDKINLQGFVFSSLKNRNKRKTDYLDDLSSSQFGFYDIKSVNGYSPVGSKRLEAVLPVGKTAHGIFRLPESLENILKQVKNFNVCQAILMRISTIIVTKENYATFSKQLQNCGYSEILIAENGKNIYASLPSKLTEGWEKNPPFDFPYVNGLHVVTHKNNVDLVNIPAHSEKITLVFPRVYWYGYTAKLNGQSLPVTSDHSGSLVQVTVPPSNQGILRLSYFPVTWRYGWFLPILALIGMAYLLMSNKNKRSYFKSLIQN